jgi:nucleotide-binding universal stress UspA family protein
MNWRERIRLFGAPGPPPVDGGPDPDRPRESVSKSTSAGPIIRSRPAGAIIVGVEGSERSADGLALADLLADRLGGPLVLVHNHPHGAPSNLRGSNADGELERSVSDSTVAQVQRFVGHDHEPGVRVTHADSPAVGLQQVAEQQNAQLVVVGPSHRSGLGQVIPGSVGERLLSRSPAPVAIAPRGYADTVPALRLVASAFDGSPESHLALEWAERLARAGNNQLRVITVHSPLVFGGLGFASESVDPLLRRDLEREQSAAIAGYDGPVEAIVPDGDPARTLVEASQQADILVMGSRGYGPLRAALLGGVSHYVVRHAACPVVILPRSADRDDSPTADRESVVRAAVPQDGG